MSPRLSELIYELWEKWQENPKAGNWRALSYAIRSGKFTIEVIYRDRFDEQMDDVQRRTTALEAVFGPVGKIDYRDP